MRNKLGTNLLSQPYFVCFLTAYLLWSHFALFWFGLLATHDQLLHLRAIHERLHAPIEEGMIPFATKGCKRIYGEQNAVLANYETYSYFLRYKAQVDTQQPARSFGFSFRPHSQTKSERGRFGERTCEKLRGGCTKLSRLRYCWR